MKGHGGIPAPPVVSTAPSNQEVEMECEEKDDGVDHFRDQPVRPPSFSSRAHRLLAGIKGYIPVIHLQDTLNVSEGVCASLPGFGTFSNRLVLGPSPTVRETVSRVAPAVLKLAQGRPGGSDSFFASPLPLAGEFIPVDQSTTLSSAEKDLLVARDLPSTVTMSRRDYALLEKRLSSSLAGMSVLASLFKALVAQTGSHEGPSDEDFIFAEDSDPVLVGLSLSAMNRTIGSLLTSVAASRLALLVPSRDSLLAVQPNLDTGDREALRVSSIPETGLFDPNLWRARKELAGKRKQEEF